MTPWKEMVKLDGTPAGRYRYNDVDRTWEAEIAGNDYVTQHESPGYAKAHISEYHQQILKETVTWQR